MVKLLSESIADDADFFVEQIHLMAIVFDNTDDVTVWATTNFDNDAHFFHLALPFKSLDVLLGDLVQTLEPMATDQGTTLVTDFPPGLPAVMCDRDRVLQVFGNLCGNAMRVTPRGGSIRVNALRDGAFICFQVSDTGPGIPAAQLASVFDRYWQAAPGSSSGAGLGLFIVKGIIEAHGGKVWADSPANQGASFFFTLPVAP